MSNYTDSERIQIAAHQMAWLTVLRHAMRELSVFGCAEKVTPEVPEALIQARTAAELAEARVTVARLCSELGVGYEENLHLGDMIENHLLPAARKVRR